MFISSKLVQFQCSWTCVEQDIVRKIHFHEAKVFEMKYSIPEAFYHPLTLRGLFILESSLIIREGV